MPPASSHLRVARPSPAWAEPTESDLGDLGVTAMIFAVGLLPVACELAGIGRWGGGSLGLGTAAALLAGRELWARLVAGRVAGRG